MNKIYNTSPILYTSPLIRISRETRISINKLYLYDLRKKYKKYYNSNYLI